jgi:hypothetical protein
LARVESLGHIGIAWWSIAFGHQAADFGQGSWRADIEAPFWSIFLTEGAAAWFLLRNGRRERRRVRRGLCTRCGYDLRAHRPGQKCPECGTPIPPPKDLKPPQSEPPPEPLPPA